MENVQMTIEDQIKKMIIAKLGLDIALEDIHDDAPLFDVNEKGEGLDLDSVDALEMAVGLRELFGITPQSTDLATFDSVQAIAKMIRNTNEK